MPVCFVLLTIPSGIKPLHLVLHVGKSTLEKIGHWILPNFPHAKNLNASWCLLIPPPCGRALLTHTKKAQKFPNNS